MISLGSSLACVVWLSEAPAPAPPVDASQPTQVGTGARAPAGGGTNERLRPGDGLFIAAGVTSAVAIGLAGVVFADGPHNERDGANLGVATLSYSLQISSLGLAVGGGIRRGRFDRGFPGAAKRRTRVTAFIATGGALLGVGVLGSAAVGGILTLRDLERTGYVFVVPDQAEEPQQTRWLAPFARHISHRGRKHVSQRELA